MAQSFGGVYRLLLDKYHIDELYDAVDRPADQAAVDGGAVEGRRCRPDRRRRQRRRRDVSGSSSVLRRMQTGSVRTYAFALFAGAVAILGYYLFR